MTPQLINKSTGKPVQLPFKTKDFRGDPVTVESFTAPHKPISTGRVHTIDGES